MKPPKPSSAKASQGTLLTRGLGDFKDLQKEQARQRWLYERAEWLIDVLVDSFLRADIDRDQLYPGIWRAAERALRNGWSLDVAKKVSGALRRAESGADKSGGDGRPNRKSRPRTPAELHELAFTLVRTIQEQEHETLPDGRKPPVWWDDPPNSDPDGEWSDACTRASKILIDGGVRQALPSTVHSWYKAHIRRRRSKSPR